MKQRNDTKSIRGEYKKAASPEFDASGCFDCHCSKSLRRCSSGLFQELLRLLFSVSSFVYFERLRTSSCHAVSSGSREADHTIKVFNLVQQIQMK